MAIAHFLDRYRSLLAGKALASAAFVWLALFGAAAGAGPRAAAAAERPGDVPDLTHYQRPLAPGEGRREFLTSSLPVGWTLVDLVVAAGLGATDNFGDQETSIAIDPTNPNHISISAFSGGWGTNAPLWSSTDGGVTWTKNFSIPAPPNQTDAAGCPCDQTYDYGRTSSLFGTILGVGNSDEPTWSGDTTNPASAAAWQWLTSSGTAVDTSHTTFSDQPWLMVNRDPVNAAQDDVYVGYTDYGAATPANHVAYSLGVEPPDFPGGQDVVVGTSSGTGFLASGAIRIATDTNDGTIYAAWEDNVSLDLTTCAKNVDFRLSRSTDDGQTWSLNGSGSGILVASHQSDEGWPDDPNLPPTACHSNVEKFGTVNALLGGSESIAVDPTSGDVFYVFHNRDSGTGNNRLEIARLTADGIGGLQVAATSFVTGLVQAALPSVAVTAGGTVGVLYDTYEGIVTGFPQFTVHLALSHDHGANWTDHSIVTFLSPANNATSNNRQRVLGDYQQLKAAGSTFYAAFPANGATAGRSTSNIDPFFLKLDVPQDFYTLAPCRVVDTRNAVGALGGPALLPHAQRTFTLSQQCGIPVGAVALSVNVTMTQPGAPGDLRVFPASVAAPRTSVVNFSTGQTRANNAIAYLSAGQLSVLLDSASAAHFLLDVNGYFLESAP